MSCPDCFKGAVHDHGTAEGTFQTLHGHRTYVASPNGSSTTTNATIIYLPDAFSLKLINNKLLADRYARETGCRVLIPDIIPGGGADVSLMNYLDIVMKPAGLNPIAWFYRAYNLLRLVIGFIPFMIKAGAPKTYPAVLDYVRAVRADQPPGSKLGVCGFCWGGYGTTRLCTEKTDKTKNLIDAAFTAHPSFLKTPDMILDAVRHGVPYSVAVAELDHMVSAKVAEDTEALLRKEIGPSGQNGTHYEFVVYKGCRHGFAVRSHADDKLEVQGEEDAARQAVDWFNRFLK